jgi:hypothetical protein
MLMSGYCDRPESARKQAVQTPDSNHPSDYHAGLLRLWRDGPGDPWRASLQDVESGERIGFADLERLFAHLRRLTDGMPDERGTSATTER